MLTLLFNIFLAGLGTAMIIKGSDWLTDSISKVTKQLATTNAAVGLLLVSSILSIPEIVVAVSSILKGYPQLGLGTILGSVIVNLGLILGISAIIKPLKISRISMLRDLSFMLVATIVVCTMALQDGTISQLDGFIFLLLFVPYVINVYLQESVLSKKEAAKEVEAAYETLTMVGKTGIREAKLHEGSKFFIIGATVLIIGSQLFTDALIYFMAAFSIPELLAGITLGALAPSIPNLAAAISASKKGLEDLAISETIGSNIFTLLVSLGIITIIRPINLDAASKTITIPALLIMSFLFVFMMMRGKITRKGGLILVASYFVIVLFEFLNR